MSSAADLLRSDSFLIYNFFIKIMLKKIIHNTTFTRNVALPGIIVLVAKRQLISLAPLVVGIVVLLNGVVNLAQALDQRREGYARWTVSMALAVVTIVLGLLVALNPFKAMELVVVAIGVVIIYNGASNLWIDSRYRKL